MKATVIPIIVKALRSILKNLIKILREVVIWGRNEIAQTYEIF